MNKLTYNDETCNYEARLLDGQFMQVPLSLYRDPSQGKEYYVSQGFLIGAEIPDIDDPLYWDGIHNVLLDGKCDCIWCD